MPRFIIKPDRDKDFYVEWSTIVDAPTEWGPAAAFRRPIAADRIDRADRNGTSAFDGFFGWDSPSLIAANMGDLDCYSLPRENLRAFLDALGDKPDDRDVQQAALNNYAQRIDLGDD